MAFVMTSTDFTHEGEMPRKLTCEGADLSPQLDWSGAPTGTKSYALIVDDPDAPDPEAPQMVYVHWVLYNLPAESTGLAKNSSSDALPAPAKEGLNDWKRTGWGGPCPPVGRHRYFFKLYALDVVLDDLGEPTKDQLLAAIKGHELAQAVLMGTYEKQG